MARMSLFRGWAVLLLVASACVERVPDCDASTCEGCCDASGVCKAGTTADACGSAGASCNVCASGESCRSTRCEAPPTTGDGGVVIVIPPDCSVPSTLDFGLVRIGQTHVRELVIDNVSSNEESASVSAPQTPGFTVTPTGALILSPGMRQRVSVDFAPVEVRGYATQISVQRGALCPVVNVLVRGEGRANQLTWSATELDFGAVNTGVAETRSLTFDNPTDTPVNVTELTTGDDFSVEGVLARVVPPNGTASVTVQFRPTEPGTRAGVLSFKTDAAHAATGAVLLVGVGLDGPGPVISTPPTLVLAPSLYPLTQVAHLPVSNVGARSLFFSTPAVSVVPLGLTAPGEFVVTLPPTYDPSVGVLSGTAPTLLSVAFSPANPWQKSALVTIFTNDFATPERSVLVSANSVAPGPCTYSVTPGSPIDLGRVRPGAQRFQTVVVTNTGAADCVLLNAQLTGNTPFEVASVSPTSLAVGQRVELQVTFKAPSLFPAAPITVTDTLRVSTNSTHAPDVDVQLEASYGPDCLLMPVAHHFGTSPPGCGSAVAQLSIINTCDVAVAVGGSSLLGENAARFTLGNSAPFTIAPGSFHALRVSYRPIDAGFDEATLEFTSTQDGVLVRHVIPLTGEGSSNAFSTDTFLAPLKRSDVLLVVDNSNTMLQHRQHLGSALTAFLQSPTQPDVRFGVITTELSDPLRSRLRRTSAGARWVARTTPNAAAELATILDVGVSGVTESCLEPASRALSDAYLYTAAENFAFVRSISHVAVVCVTDASEQSPNPIAYDLARLSMVRSPQRPEAFSYNVIGPFLPTPPLTCEYDGTNMNGKHDAALSELNGVREEICTTNWPATVSRVMDHVLTMPPRRFTLLRRPVVSNPDISVTVGGAAVPAVSGTQTNWTFDAMKNQVVFSGAGAPSSGDEVSVSYTSICF